MCACCPQLPEREALIPKDSKYWYIALKFLYWFRINAFVIGCVMHSAPTSPPFNVESDSIFHKLSGKTLNTTSRNKLAYIVRLVIPNILFQARSRSWPVEIRLFSMYNRRSLPVVCPMQTQPFFRTAGSHNDIRRRSRYPRVFPALIPVSWFTLLSFMLFVLV